VPIYSDEAIADLTGIRAYIAQNNPPVAAEKAAEIDDTCNLLDMMPGMGRKYRPPLWYFPKEVWIIVYEPTPAGALIHRIFDSRQNWRAHLG
jgi:plasmid stabilization system protein ParE